MSEYQIKKEQVRQCAIDWQDDFNNHNYSYGEMVLQQERFYKLARRYGLMNEFRENAII